MFEGVLAGVDGSRCALDATMWAARAAYLHRSRLQLVHVVEPEPGVDPGKAEDVGRRALAEAAAMVDEAFSDVRPRTLLLHGDPGKVLLQHAERVGFAVLGRHGGDIGAPPGTGSTAYEVARHLRCPVILVPEGRTREHGSVIVGVDGSDEAGHALRFAFEEAALRGCRLRVVHIARMRPGSAPRQDVRMPERVRRLSAAVLAGRSAADPQVDVVEEAYLGSPAQELVALGADAALLVVGSHGLGGVHLPRERLFGSVSDQVVHTAHCPVAVIRR